MPAEIIGATMAPDYEILEPVLIRRSDTAGVLTECPCIRSGDVGSYLRLSTSASASRYG